MGNEIRVNTYQNNWQRNSHITTFADGSFLVVWDSYLNNYEDGEPTATYVAGQRFRGDGTRIGGEFVIDGSDGCSSESARVTTLKDGGFVVVWAFDDYDDILTMDTEIWAKVYNADGSVRTGRFRVDQIASNNAVLPDVAARGDGGFQITWGNDSSTGTFEDVRTRAYDASGRALGPDSLLNTGYREFDEINARSCTLNSGRVIAIWGAEGDRPGGDVSDNGIRGTIFDASGRVIRGDFDLGPTLGQVGDETNYGYDVAPMSNGGFVMCSVDWSHAVPGSTMRLGTFVLVSTYDQNGRIAVNRAPVIETDEVIYNARVTQLATGQIVVVWVQGGADGDVGRDVMARVLDGAGRPLSPVFEVGIDGDRYDDQDNVEIAALPGGGFVVIYDSESIDIDHEGVAARIYGRGTAGNDVLTVDATQTMTGLGGNDRISGNAQHNVLRGGTGNDLLTDLAGGNDTLSGDDGDDTLQSGAGNDVLTGGAGNDLIIGGDGVDTAVYAGTARLHVDLAITSPQATGQGRDRLSGIENLIGGSAGDGLYGNALANVLNGGAGDDVLSGAGGSDTLIGGAGRDRLLGGAGNDVFLFTAPADAGIGGQAEFVHDFARGQDRLSLAALDADAARGGDQAFLWGGPTARAHGAWHAVGVHGTMVSLDLSGDARADMQIFLAGVHGVGAGDLLL